MLDKLKVGSYIADKMENGSEKMTNKKQTGAGAAAEEIVAAIVEDVGRMFNYHRDQDTIDRTILQVEAIILKHCPQDKAEKLVKACKAALPILEDAYGGQQPPPRYEIKLVKEALAEHERAQGE